MINIKPIWRYFPIIGLTGALVLTTGLFFQSERYRNKTETILNQTYEIQWRSSQAREYLVRIYGYLRLAEKTGQIDSDFERSAMLVRVNITQLESLPYLQNFFQQQEIELLKSVQRTIEQIIPTVLTGQTTPKNAISVINYLQEDMYKISSETVDHSASLQETAAIKMEATRNWFFFLLTLLLGSIFVISLHQRYLNISRRDQAMRAFASLFAHATRTRIAALRWFLNTSFERRPSSHVLQAAKDVALELETITERLLSTAYPKCGIYRQYLYEIIGKISEENSCLQTYIEPTVKWLPVPGAQFRLLLDELIQNALEALKNTENPQMSIRAFLKRSTLLRRPMLILEVTDNGAGMTPEILANAIDPFYSTRAGKHAGLGLTGCWQLISSLKGKLLIQSKQGVGTSIQIRLLISSLNTLTPGAQQMGSIS